MYLASPGTTMQPTIGTLNQTLPSLVLVLYMYINAWINSFLYVFVHE